jgi:hypothetical protein
MAQLTPEREPTLFTPSQATAVEFARRFCVRHAPRRHGPPSTPSTARRHPRIRCRESKLSEVWRRHVISAETLGLITRIHVGGQHRAYEVPEMFHSVDVIPFPDQSDLAI